MSRKVQSGFLYDQVKETIESEANHGWRLTQVIIPNKGKHSISGKKRLRLGAFFPWCYQLIFEKDEKENGGQYPGDSRRRGTGRWTKGYGEDLSVVLYLFLTCFFTVIWGKMKGKECGQNRPEKLRNQGVMEWQ